jgi:hypothetical protein
MGWTWGNNHSFTFWELLGRKSEHSRLGPWKHIAYAEKRYSPQTQKIWPEIEHVVHLTSNIPSQIWRWLLAIGFARFISAILEEPISGWLTRRGPHADDHRPGQDACEDQAILHHEMRNLTHLQRKSHLFGSKCGVRTLGVRCSACKPFKGAEATRNAIKEQAISIPGQGTLRAEKYLLAATGQPPGMFFLWKCSLR